MTSLTRTRAGGRRRRWRRAVPIALGIACASVLLSACFPPAPPLSHASPIPPDTTQMVSIVSAGWPATTGIMSLDQRTPGGAWTWTGYSALVDFGPSGMGWGVGLHQGGQGPQKREGDGRSPAGVFHLGHAFGYAPFPTRMPYWQVGPQHWCVDDSGSPHYNQIVDTNYTPVDWRHAEPMFRPDGQYQLGLVVNHNPGNTPGYGSCIFLHVWQGLGATTAGCTAMPLASVGALLQWLDPAQDPVLLQMPLDQYRGIEGDWHLPIR